MVPELRYPTLASQTTRGHFGHLQYGWFKIKKLSVLITFNTFGGLEFLTIPLLIAEKQHKKATSETPTTPVVLLLYLIQHTNEQVIHAWHTPEGDKECNK